MQFKVLCASVVGVAGIAGAIAVAQQRPASTQAQGGPTLAELQRAVAGLEGGRIQRPSSYEALTPEQKNYVNGILSGPRGAISGPLSVMMVSPAMGSVLQTAMAYARFAGREGFSSVPPKLNELAILMAARTWSAEYVWNAHSRAAVTEGVSPDVVEAVRLGKRPAAMEKDVEAIYNFVNELLTTKKVSNPTFEAAKAVLRGDRGVVDLVGTVGLYQISSMLVVVDQLGPAQGAKPNLPPLATP
jgi:4-carboxymuconolactone decarboxylase